jgi:lipoprotein NlpI/transglutaminase-like putative cysteine protease
VHRSGFQTACALALALIVATPLTARAATKNAADEFKPALAKGAYSYQIEPAPAWVVPAKERANARVDAAPMHYRVIDEQVRVEGRSMSAYSHVVRVVNDASGLGIAAQIELEFDPSYQTFALHHLTLVRDGKTINKLDRKRIQLLQRETQLERQMYDGRVTLSVVLDDVRAGDQIDFAYTVRGANPVFDGRFAYTTWMTSSRGPTALYQVRLLAPADRRVNHRIGVPDVQTESKLAGGLRETVFRREATAQFRAEANAPANVAAPQQLQFSEFADWADVAHWGQALFAARAGGVGGVNLDHKAAEIREHSTDRAVQVLTALDFVQKEVRYFGTEVGVGSHRPTAPEQVFEQRFGDCKDKVGLLVALLQRLNVSARPVLVSTYLRSRMPGQLPSPLAFDHVIARVELDGTIYWLDATRTQQTGNLARRQALGFVQGLALAPETTALEALPQPFDRESMSVVDTVRIERFAADPVLESRVTYRGDLAEILRTGIAQRGLADVNAAIIAPYLRIYPKLQAVAQPQIENAIDDDALTLIQRFVIPGFWSFPEERSLRSESFNWAIFDALSVPKSESRRDPLGISFPGIVRQRLVIEFPEDVYAQPGSQRYDEGDAHVSVQGTVESTRRRLEYDMRARLAVEQIDPQDWPAHLARLAKITSRLGITTTVSALPLERIPALERELKRTDAALKERRVKVVTANQAQALFKSIVLSAQLEGDRLPPTLRAQALNARGVQYDHLGRWDDAQKDFDRALALAADVPEIQNAAAMNALMTHRFDRAIELTSRSLERNPRDLEAINTRALARYLGQNLPAARADWQEMLKDGASVRRGYPIVWLSMTMRQRHEDPAVLASQFGNDQLPGDWPRPLVDMALGRADPDAVIRAAKAAKSPLESLCEAYFYIGERYYADGDLGRATEFWRKSVEQGVVEFVEHGASRLRLATVGTK